MNNKQIKEFNYTSVSNIDIDFTKIKGNNIDFKNIITLIYHIIIGIIITFGVIYCLCKMPLFLILIIIALNSIKK